MGVAPLPGTQVAATGRGRPDVSIDDIYAAIISSPAALYLPLTGGSLSGNLSTSALAQITASGDLISNFGNCIIQNAGKGLTVKEGSDAKMGTAVLNGTTAVVVSNANVTATSRIFLTINVPGGTPASPYVFARTPGVSFSIKSTGASDSSTVAFLIVEPS